MIRSFGGKGTEDLWNGLSTAASRRIPGPLWRAAQRKLDMIHAARDVNDLRAPPGNRVEKLKGPSRDLHSIRINDQFRVIFRWIRDGAEDVEVVDYH
ncbi:MAG: type II toxin-antitoxin system RelE/ParE family toxin [Elusimicrobia bacterium]|nr:type II toxin-antitoxin system RelE/ParE family toxin [Elusimicrobiota bacterium]